MSNRVEEAKKKVTESAWFLAEDARQYLAEADQPYGKVTAITVTDTAVEVTVREPNGRRYTVRIQR